MIFDDKIYNPNEINKFLRAICDDLPIVRKNKIAYYNIPCAFDIETSSFYDRGAKVAIMYVWQISINGHIMIGRTWPEFISLCDSLTGLLGLSESKRLIIYVHNLGYEFQFMRKYFKWVKVFSQSIRKPIYAVTETGLEFRCSYILSGYSLTKVAEHLQYHKVEKLVGDLDYNLVRHSTTPLTDAELGYCINDVKIVTAHIRECIDNSKGKITNIPLTKTGYVRKFCRNATLYKDRYKGYDYRKMISKLTLDTEEYKQLKRGFQGGFTHANAYYIDDVVENVSSYDFTSSYPAVMIAEKFPMSRAEKVEIKSKEEFEKNLKLYCCIFDIELTNVKPKVFYENYISRSKCWGVENAVVNNGRIVYADRLCTTITEQDYAIISIFYTWDHMRVRDFRRYRKGYLPTLFVKAILDLYLKKTELKGVAGAEVEYLQSKEMLNSCYGMTVTDIAKDDVVYTDDEWSINMVNVAEKLDEYNKKKSRFLFYPWGVWVTAYARRNLFTAISECEHDYIYSDTDSVKIQNAIEHTKYFERYNEWIISRLHKACEYHRINDILVHPKTIKGVEKYLGVWDYESDYQKFKTLGAKRYMTEKDGKISITVSGLNKGVTVPYLQKQGKNIFSIFTDDLYIPQGETGKQTHTYIDEERTGRVIDYLGNENNYHELSCIHLENADYSLSIGRELVEYIFSLDSKIIGGSDHGKK